MNSQAFIESQTQNFTEEFQQPLANQDFQAEFLKCMFKENEIEEIASNARTTHDPSTQPQVYDSQTDIETVIRTYLTDNPNWTENIASKVSNKYSVNSVN